MSWWSRFSNVFRAGRLDHDLDAELQFHLEERIGELIASGMTRDEAEAQVRRRFGTALRWREQSRDVKLLPWLDSLGARRPPRRPHAAEERGRDRPPPWSRCRWRSARAPAAFSLVDALILRPLSVHDPERLVYLTLATVTPTGASRRRSTTRRSSGFATPARGQVDLFAMSTQSCGR